jgi:probable F420-dependent oxidoreductase
MMGLKLGVAFSATDMGASPGALRDFALLAEEIGYDDLMLPDHVLGVNTASRPDWGARNTSRDAFHDPFVAFGFLSAVCRRIHFSTQVLILAQRQATLVAKQAANVAVLSEGRFRLGIGVGWNEAEFIGLNESFHNRGRRSEEQIEVMQALWAQDHVDFKGRWHTIPDAGINPRPACGKVPVWFGGHMDVTLRRIARLGDGWMMNVHPPGEVALADFATLRRYTEEAGRDPASVEIEVWTSMGAGSEADWRREAQFWKQAGVTRITLNTTFNRNHHKRIPGRSFADHAAAIRRWHRAVADLA